MKKLKKYQSGQSLITLLFFMVIGITVISAASIIVIINIFSASNSEKGLKAYYVAEGGVEDALLRLLRNPTLVATYTFSSDDGTASVDIQNTNSGGIITDTIISTGMSGTTTRKIQVITTYTEGARSITTWEEIQ